MSLRADHASGHPPEALPSTLRTGAGATAGFLVHGRPGPGRPAGPSELRGRDARLPAGTRRILHLDVDAFLASVEQAVHPELAGLPVVVGGLPTDRNLVMSCSYPARAFGVRPGLLLSEAARLCPQAIFRRGDSQAANRLREQTVRLLRRSSPLVEVASIDDFFVDLTGCAHLTGSAFDVAEGLRAAIRDEVGLPVTIGVGTNRLLARLAGKLAKPGGVAELLPGHETAFLARLPVDHLPGVGHSIGPALARFGVRTVGQLRQVSREVLFASFGRPGLLIHERARGLDPEPVEPTHVEDEHGRLTPRAPVSIRRDSTFEPEEGRREIVEAMLSYVVERASHRLRSHGSCCRSLEVRVRYVDTRPQVRDGAEAHDGDERGPASSARRRALATPSDSTDVLWRHARALFRELPRRRALVKRIGLTLVDLTPRAGWQGHLFDSGPSRAPTDSDGDAANGTRVDRHRRLDAALDRLRERHGFGRVVRGASLPLIATHPLGADGFRLRTPSLNQ